ncbi:unnamed protein product [Prunus armeniaca]
MAGTSNNSIKHYVRSTYAHQVFSTEQGRLPKTQKTGWASITFCEDEERGVILPHDDPIIICADISNFDVGRILVDTAVTQALAPPRAGTKRPEDPREESATQQAEPVEDLELVTLHEDILDRQVRIGTSLSQELRSDLIAFLRLNSEVFAWSYNDMPGISPDVISHRLSINPVVRPVRQKRCAYDPERYEAMKAEVDKLSTIGFIKEVDYPTWLANVVMLVDATASHALLSFMDAYSGYNQIFMHPEDQAHTSFIIDRGLYCYKVMPFGLKNAGATYQRLVNSIFAPLIGNTMEQYRMRLNPTKCAFGVASGKFLGFMISQRGIEANLEKIQAILDMTIPKTVKDIQSLTGRVAALTRFISKATDRCAPLFKALKGSKRSITWTAECDQAFGELKAYMSRAPLLSTPESGDVLTIYLSVSATAVSSVLIRPHEGAEHPVHYVSKGLQDAEIRYPDIEKLAFALVVSARRLRPYFQAHTIHVLTNQPLRHVAEARDFLEGQAVADFISEFTKPHTLASPQIAITPTPTSNQVHVANNGSPDLTQPLWTLYVDDSSNAQGCEAGLVLISPDKVALEYALRFKFHASNNEAEYEALLAGLRLAKEMGTKQIQIFSDSQLVVHQVNQDFTAKDVSMTAYLQHTHHLLTTFNAYLIGQVPRSENSHADALARLASAMEQGIGQNIHIEFLDQPSTRAPLICVIDQSPTWMDPITQFLQNQTLPADPAEARRVRYRSARYLIINGALYKRGFSLPYLQCLTPEEGTYVLREIHEGICGNHSGAHSLAHKIIRQGYFWPSLHTDAQTFTQKCDKCQRFANIPQLPAEPLTAMVSPWPFAQWGLDLIGPMPEGKGQVKYAVVAVDYFTKWAEAEALATITAARIETFVWQNIVCRFGIPNTIVTDNGQQFDNAKFKQFCSNLKIKLCFASPAHPQSNGQVEAVNKIIKKTLKTKLDKAKGCWPELLPEVLWSYRTTFRTSTRETPFSLSFGTEAVALVEIGQPTYRTSTYEAKANDEQLALNLDFIDELRDQSNMRNVAYKQRIAKYYDSRVKARAFKLGDWVMRKISLATKNPTEGTLGPT